MKVPAWVGLQVDQDREREKEKVIQMKDDDLGSGSGKRRRIKRDHLPANDLLLNYVPAAAPLLPSPALAYEGRDRERKSGPLPARGPPYMDEVSYEKGPSSGRSHGKEGSKVSRREHDQYPFNATLDFLMFL